MVAEEENHVATGPFTVQLQPQDATLGVGRMTIEKAYEGDLVGSGMGQMLTWRDESSGAASYVAVERVEGTLHGRAGSFVLLHRGAMTAEEQSLSVTVAPGSGTGELEGMTGTMTIQNVDGEHAYELSYGFADSSVDPGSG